MPACRTLIDENALLMLHRFRDAFMHPSDERWAAELVSQRRRVLTYGRTTPNKCIYLYVYVYVYVYVYILTTTPQESYKCSPRTNDKTLSHTSLRAEIRL